jgi:hypothetical protein
MRGDSGSNMHHHWLVRSMIAAMFRPLGLHNLVEGDCNLKLAEDLHHVRAGPTSTTFPGVDRMLSPDIPMSLGRVELFGHISAITC